MNRAGLAQGVIDALPEPAFLLGLDGGVIGANRAARELLGPEAASGNVDALLATPPADFARYLARARRTSSPVPGALVFRTPGGERRLRAHCARLTGLVRQPVLLLRCDNPRADRFSILAARVRRLDADLRLRVREKAILAEALERNRNLMRELQHRVKNNIQMMISLLSMSAMNSDSEEVARFVDGAKRRFRALATTQDLIYEAQSAGAIPARELLGRLAAAFDEGVEGVVVEVDSVDVRLPQDSAHCLALIVNELVTNCVKHGLDGGAGRIRISLDREAGGMRLVVQDDGSGYPPLDSLPRSSGLTLIRGLCRQIGASLELGNDGGARSVVAFSADRTEDADGAGGADARPETTPAAG